VGFGTGYIFLEIFGSDIYFSKIKEKYLKNQKSIRKSGTAATQRHLLLVRKGAIGLGRPHSTVDGLRISAQITVLESEYVS
jgi:hypothetical protein